MFARMFRPLNRLILLTVLALPATAPAADESLTTGSDELLKFEEVFPLIEEHLGTIGADELSDAAARGLIRQLSPQVRLVTNGERIGDPADGADRAITTRRFDDGIVYLRLGRVGDESIAAFREGWRELQQGGAPRGLVLDLRFAGGDDYGAAARLAEMFYVPADETEPETVLLTWGDQSYVARRSDDPVSLPVAILINGATHGSAEATAAALKRLRAGLLVGSATSGRAGVFQEFPLAGGQRLRIASIPVFVGEDQPLSGVGLEPDLEVNPDATAEPRWLGDPYGEFLVSTNANTGRRRINEADLERQRREGISLEEIIREEERAEPDSDLKIVRDPALARALDVLKGLALMRQWENR